MAPLVEVGLAGVGPVWIHRCPACGFRQVRPRLGVGALAAIYAADYFDPASPHGFAGYARQRQRYEREAYFLARELRAMREKGRLLEVGSALGFLLDALTHLTSWRVEGVEVSAFGAWYARSRFGVTVHDGTLEEASFPSGTFDYVLQKDLLEHVIHPRRHLEETWRIMRRGGRLRVITPNGDADVLPVQRAAAGARPGKLPVLGQGHLSFFSRPQLLRMLDDVGFRVLRFRSIGVRRGVHALGLLPGWRSRAPLAPREALDTPGPAGNATRSGVTASGTDGERGGGGRPDATNEDRAARIDAEIGRRYRRIRAWRTYYHYRRVMKRLDSLPATLAAGQDFDLLLERR